MKGCDGDRTPTRTPESDEQAHMAWEYDDHPTPTEKAERDRSNAIAEMDYAEHIRATRRVEVYLPCKVKGKWVYLLFDGGDK